MQVFEKIIFYNVKYFYTRIKRLRIVVISNFSKLKNTSTNSSKSYSEINRIISHHSEHNNFSNAKKLGFKKILFKAVWLGIRRVPSTCTYNRFSNFFFIYFNIEYFFSDRRSDGWRSRRRHALLQGHPPAHPEGSLLQARPHHHSPQGLATDMRQSALRTAPAHHHQGGG